MGISAPTGRLRRRLRPTAVPALLGSTRLTTARRRPRLRSAALPALIVLTMVATACAGGPPGGGGGHGKGGKGDTPREPTLPIVFVHGGSGSAAQYETQALRFASNDYPNVVTAIDRISATPEVINPILDDFFDEVLAETGDDRLYVVGHSLGVSVMNNYLDSSPERAARVAKYIGIDSASGPSRDRCPGGEDNAGDWVTPCIGIFGRGDPDRQFGPDYSVQFEDQGHVEVVGSAESFVEQYQFFTGEEPETTLVLPEPPGEVEISGRAQDFPANTPLAGSTVEVWEIDGESGARTSENPVDTLTTGEDGFWGPVNVDGEQHYELALTRDDITQHFYWEPFVRSNDLIRLNLTPADSPISDLIERSDDHSIVVVQRMKEWWGDLPEDSDTLEAITTSASQENPAPVNLVNESSAPSSGNTIGLITFDVGSDGVTNPDGFPIAGFVNGVDVFYPAADPPDGTISLVHDQRGEDLDQMLNAPNWTSTNHGISFSFRDWSQEPLSWDDCVDQGLC